VSRLLIFHIDGEYDWMDPVGGITSIDNLKAAGNENARMYIVPRAGHHGKPLLACTQLVLTCFSSTVYLDNAKAMNKLLLRELNEQPPST
jgi:cardiolipin-specific phospholipase